METFMTLMILAGPLFAAVGGVFAIYRVIALARSREPKQAVHLVGLSVVVGLVSYFAGGLIGTWALCSPAGASNLCGLGGIIGTGPLAMGISLIALSRRAANHGVAA